MFFFMSFVSSFWIFLFPFFSLSPLFLFFPPYYLFNLKLNLINIKFPVLSRYFFPSFFLFFWFFYGSMTFVLFFLPFHFVFCLFSAGLFFPHSLYCISVWLCCLCGIAVTHTHTHTHTHTLGPLFHLWALSRGERALCNEEFMAVWCRWFVVNTLFSRGSNWEWKWNSSVASQHQTNLHIHQWDSDFYHQLDCSAMCFQWTLFGRGSD